MNTDIHALTGSYAVDALDDLERARFESHLAECADCRAEVASLRAAATELSALTSTTPPSALRDKVLAGIREVRPQAPEPGEATAPTTASDPAPGTSPGASPARHRRAPRVAPRWVAAAAAVAIGAAGVTIWQPWERESQGQRTVATQVRNAPDAQQVRRTFPGGASATVIRSESLGRAILVTEKMPPAPDRKVYQAWLQRPDGTMVSAGLMPPRSDQVVVLEGDARQAIAAGITVEPEGGSVAPTSDPIALFDFA